MLSCSYAYSDGLADFGGQSSISLAEEERIGTQWWRKNYKQLNPYADFLLHLYVEDLMARLGQGEELSAYRLRIRILSSPAFNAFAVPGGIVGINMGMWRLGETEGEFATVLAHELAHISQRHFIRMLEDARQRNSVSIASTLAGLGLILAGNAPAGLLAIYGVANFHLESHLETSRRFEREADRQAALFIRRGRFPLVDAANMYRRLLQTGGGETGVEYMMTHPFLADRINDAQLRAGRERDSQSTSPRTDYFYTRIRAFSALDLLDSFSLRDAKGPLAKYIQATRLRKVGKNKAAVTLFKQVADANPASRFLFLSYVEALIEAQETRQAMSLLIEKKRYGGDNPAWHYYSALAYAMDKNYLKAAEEMEIVARNRVEDERIWKLLWGYYENLQDKYNTLRARMAYRMLTGETESAQTNLELARQEAIGNEIRLARLTNLHARLNIEQ